MKSLLLAIALAMSPFTASGLLVVSVWLFTGMMCFKIDWIRNLMFGFYIVGGFWFFLAG